MTKRACTLSKPKALPSEEPGVGGVLANHDCAPHATGGAADHIHIACELGRKIAIAELIAELKRASTLWIKQTFPNTQTYAWQTGYGAFSISPAHLEDLRRYIHNQHDHHKTATFQDEYRHLLQKYQIPYDEKYLWD